MDPAALTIQGLGVVAIIRRGGYYLLIQRAPGILAGGAWCFVGGAVESGETQEQAVVREVAEEVGLVVEPLRDVWQCWSANRKWRLHCWDTRLLSDDLRPNPAEVSDFRWLTRGEIERWPDLLPSVLDFFANAAGG